MNKANARAAAKLRVNLVGIDRCRNDCYKYGIKLVFDVLIVAGVVNHSSQNQTF